MTSSTNLARTIESADASLVPHLLSLSKSVRQLVGIKLAECEVAVGQDQFLLCFENEDALGIIDIASRLSVRASTVSKMVDILERKGWTVRESDRHDLRRVRVRLTDAGRAVAREVRVIERKLEKELVAAMGDDEEVAVSLARLEDLLARRLNRLR